MNNIYKKFNSKSTNISLEEAFNDVLRDATVLNTLQMILKNHQSFYLMFYIYFLVFFKKLVKLI